MIITKQKLKGYSNHDLKTRCWIWTRSTNTQGYGQIWIGSKNYAAHRLSWIIYKGQIPNKLLVCHTCDNPRCINPKHLFLGTHYDNSIDALIKGRLHQIWKPKTHCHRGHKMDKIQIRNGHIRNICSKCKNITRDAQRRKLGKSERIKRNQ
jgi:hypothetical protein